jgi:hypothetical protein
LFDSVSELLWISFSFYMVIGVLCFVSFHYLMISLPQRKRRWKNYRWYSIKNNERLEWFLSKVLWISTHEKYVEVYKQLLAGSGIKVTVFQYFFIKRLVTGTFVFIGLMAYLLMQLPMFLNPLYFAILLILSIAGGVVCLLDKSLLEAIRKRRSERIVQDVYVLSNQLLYYSGSKMNLHSKLKRCIPNLKMIRNDMYLLTSEWYEGAESAIHRFKFRLGTDEGFSFAETLNSLRLHESELYYELLRQRIQDYKEKIELNKDSKKETNSYILFVLAGLPILNTFRVFVYPWVQEGQKLFETLN